ncbi:MAG: HEAT repeat domain-containing protein [Nitrospirota bacterium]
MKKHSNISRLKKICLIAIMIILILSSQGHTSTSQNLIDQCIQIIIRGLEENKEIIRLDSISSIENNKIANPALEEKIEEIFLNDNSEVVRAAAAQSLARMKGKDAIPVLRQALKYKGRQEYLIHISVSAALYNLGEKDAISYIAKYLSSEITAESREAALTSGGLVDNQVIPLLKARLHTKNPLLRNSLLISLAKQGDKMPETEIDVLINSKQLDNQWTALNLIDILKIKRFNSSLKRMLDDNNPITRIRVAKLLTVLGDEDMKNVIVEYLMSNEGKYGDISGQDVRVVAMYEGLSAVGSTSDLNILKKFLTKDNRERIIAASTIIAILGKQ